MSTENNTTAHEMESFDSALKKADTNSFSNIMQTQPGIKQNFNMSMEDAIKNKVHLGHGKVHYTMEQNIFTQPKLKDENVSIINLDITKRVMQDVFEYIEKVLENGKGILIVGANPSSAPSEINTQQEDLIKTFAKECGIMSIVNEIPSGILTNKKQVIDNGINRYETLQKMVNENQFATSAEASKLKRQQRKIYKRIEGFESGANKDIGLVLVINNSRAARKIIPEAFTKHIPVVAFCDTNVSTDKIDFVIPCNTSSIASVAYILDNLRPAIENGHAAFIDKLRSKNTINDKNKINYKFNSEFNQKLK